MSASSTHDCKYSAWYWLSQVTGEIKAFNCGSWSCSQHRGAVAFHWACRVAETHPERMLTLTNIPHDKATAYLGFQHLIQEIRHEGIRMEYCRFLEVGQESGMRHFHVAQRGDYIPQRWLSSRASKNGLGRIVHIEACHGAGPAFYLSKYIVKDSFALPGWRKVSSSRGFFRKKELPADIRDDDWLLIRA